MLTFVSDRIRQLLLAAASLPQYADLFKLAVDYAKSKSTDPKEQVSICLDKLAVTFGAEILKIIPGRVSTEIDARLSFDTAATVSKAHQLAQMYRGMLFWYQFLSADFQFERRRNYFNFVSAAISSHSFLYSFRYWC